MNTQNTQNTQPSPEVHTSKRAKKRARAKAKISQIAEVKTNVCIYGFGSAGVKAAYIAGKEIRKKHPNVNSSWVRIFAVDSDGGFLKEQNRLHSESSVVSIALRSDKGLANGTGGIVEEGEKRARMIKEIIQREHVKRAKDNREVAIMVGCAGGGTIGAMKVFARMFREADIRTIVILCKPAPRGARYTRAYTTIRRELLEIGVTMIPIEDARVDKHNEDLSPKELFDQMNERAVVPPLTTLRAVLQTVADTCNCDDSDLEKILKPGHIAYVGTWVANLSQPHSDTDALAKDIFKSLTNQELQYEREKVIVKAKDALIWANGIKSYKLIDQVETQIYASMRGSQTEENNEVRIKEAINVGTDNEPQWFTFITSAKLDEYYKEPSEEKEEESEAHLEPSHTVHSIINAPDIQPDPIVEMTTTVYVEGGSSNRLPVPKKVRLPKDLAISYEGLPESSINTQDLNLFLDQITSYLREQRQIDHDCRATISLKTHQDIEHNRRTPLLVSNNGHHS